MFICFCFLLDSVVALLFPFSSNEITFLPKTKIRKETVCIFFQLKKKKPIYSKIFCPDDDDNVQFPYLNPWFYQNKVLLLKFLAIFVIVGDSGGNSYDRVHVAALMLKYF